MSARHGCMPRNEHKVANLPKRYCRKCGKLLPATRYFNHAECAPMAEVDEDMLSPGYSGFSRMNGRMETCISVLQRPVGN
jgi:hypothetical protein